MNRRAFAHVPAVAVALVAGACAPSAMDDAPAEDAAPREGVFGIAPRPVGGVPAVVTLTGEAAGDRLAPAEAVMDQLGLQFSPTRLIVRVGATVDFRNSESIAHNVQINAAEDGAHVFSSDTPPDGNAPFTFDAPGGYDVTCEIHPGMRAFVFVTDAPFALFADDDGAFEITDVPPGSYRLEFWSLDPAARAAHDVEIVAGRATEVATAPSE